MNALLVLIPVTFLRIMVAAGVFFWTVNHTQFDDTDSPKILPLLDADEAQELPTKAADTQEPKP